LPFCHAEVRSAKPKSDRYPKELKSLGDHIRARRIDLGILQRQVAEHTGVCEATITNWERNESRPLVQYIPGIVGFLGYDPSAPTTSLPERLIAARRAQGLTRREMAGRMGVDPSTLQDWESGLHKPSNKKARLISDCLR
jgi:transcriptional regulator with XRE-family HTH domain